MSQSELPGIPPNVVELFEQYTLQLVAAGFSRYSARAVLHRIRWHYHVDKGDRGFKCNNNWTPRMARWFMRKHPTQDGFFEIRASPGKGGPGHDMSDYTGPYAGKPNGNLFD